MFVSKLISRNFYNVSLSLKIANQPIQYVSDSPEITVNNCHVLPSADHFRYDDVRAVMGYQRSDVRRSAAIPVVEDRFQRHRPARRSPRHLAFRSRSSTNGLSETAFDFTFPATVYVTENVNVI